MIVQIQQDENGECFIVIPDEFQQQLGWDENTKLVWSIDGRCATISKENSDE